MMNKKGWIKIVEAFFAILLVMGVLLVVMNRGGITQQDISKKVYEVEVSILREIEVDNNLRDTILKINEDILPVKWGNDNFPANLKTKVKSRTPNYLNCQTQICEIGKVCSLNTFIDKDVYSQEIRITADQETYAPKLLKIFCWVR